MRAPLPASPQKRGRAQVQNSQLPLGGVEPGQDGGGGFPLSPLPRPHTRHSVRREAVGEKLGQEKRQRCDLASISLRG